MSEIEKRDKMSFMKEFESIRPDLFFPEHWTNDQIDQAVEHMRSIHRKRTDGSLNLNTQGVLSARQFSWEVSSNKLNSLLSR